MKIDWWWVIFCIMLSLLVFFIAYELLDLNERLGDIEQALGMYYTIS